jgi:hypothetical protein
MIARLAVLAASKPVEESHDADDERDTGKHQKGIFHGYSPSSTSANVTNASHSATPARISNHDIRLWPTNCPKINAAAP